MTALIWSILLLSWLGEATVAAPPNIWTVLAFDARGDARDPSQADAAQLSYRYDSASDTLWFRVGLYSRPNADAFGITIAVDTGDDRAQKMDWWGGNKNFKFDKVLTAWVTRVDGRYQGTIGVGDAAGAGAANINNLQQNNLQIRTDGEAIVIGVKRSDVTDRMKMNVVAATGSRNDWNDDVPNAQSAPLDLSAPRPSRGLRELDLDRNNFRFAAGDRTLADDKPAQVVRRGSGRQSLILIPGMYSGAHAFDGFIARHQSQYAFYILTPPGLNGTPPRPLPAETVSWGELPWTRRLEKDIADLIKREALDKPVIVVHGFPGTLAARNLAITSADLVGGIIDISSTAVQRFPSPLDPARPATPDERVAVVNEGWTKRWFKHVTPETWESNNYPSHMYANDPQRAERVRRQAEATSLAVKIRYLAEFMASDQSSDLVNLKAPLLVLRPGFNDALLASPENSWFKICFLDSWDAFSKNPKIQVITIANARALILDDQPDAADAAIAAFLDANALRKSERP